jgi:hypothetical protein
MSFQYTQSTSSQLSCDESKTHLSDQDSHKTCKQTLALEAWGFFPHISLGVEGWLWIGWIVGFDWFECFLFFMVVGARNKLRSTLLTLFLTSYKLNTQFVCAFGCTLFNLAQILLNHFLTQNSLLKTCSQIGTLLLQLCVLFDSMKKITLERIMYYAWRG